MNSAKTIFSAGQVRFVRGTGEVFVITWAPSLEDSGDGNYTCDFLGGVVRRWTEKYVHTMTRPYWAQRGTTLVQRIGTTENGSALFAQQVLCPVKRDKMLYCTTNHVDVQQLTYVPEQGAQQGLC